jgi:hypothetical protein
MKKMAVAPVATSTSSSSSSPAAAATFASLVDPLTLPLISSGPRFLELLHPTTLTQWRRSWLSSSLILSDPIVRLPDGRILAVDNDGHRLCILDAWHAALYGAGIVQGGQYNGKPYTSEQVAAASTPSSLMAQAASITSPPGMALPVKLYTAGMSMLPLDDNMLGLLARRKKQQPEYPDLMNMGLELEDEGTTFLVFNLTTLTCVRRLDFATVAGMHVLIILCIS